MHSALRRFMPRMPRSASRRQRHSQSSIRASSVMTSLGEGLQLGVERLLYNAGVEGSQGGCAHLTPRAQPGIILGGTANGLHCACALHTHTHPHPPTHRRRSQNDTKMDCIALARCTHMPWPPGKAQQSRDANRRSKTGNVKGLLHGGGIPISAFPPHLAPAARAQQRFTFVPAGPGGQPIEFGLDLLEHLPAERPQ